MNVRFGFYGVFESAYTNEQDFFTGAAINAPQCDAAVRAAEVILALAAVGVCPDALGLALQNAYLTGLNYRVQRKG